MAKNREKQNEATHRWYLKNKEKKSEYDKQRYIEKKEHIQSQKKEYKSTPNGRASYLLGQYNVNDKRHGRGKGDLTAQWIVENILFKPCAHCGKTGWEIIGCNRLDNSKPHTKDNVEPCCKECNCLEYGKESAKIVDQISMIDGEVIKTWESITECKNQGFNIGHIWECCRGKRNKHKGYKWLYKPM